MIELIEHDRRRLPGTSIVCDYIDSLVHTRNAGMNDDLEFLQYEQRWDSEGWMYVVAVYWDATRCKRITVRCD